MLFTLVLPIASATDVLLVSDPADQLQELQTDLIQLGLFGTVDTWNAGASEPTYADLIAYDGVVLYAGNEISSVLGQALADFVDQGGNLVTDATIGWWMARAYGFGDLNSYVAIDATQNRFGGPATITWQIPDHPLLTNVGSISIPYYLDNAGTAKAGAALVGVFPAAAVATWRPSSSGVVTTFGFNLTPARSGGQGLSFPNPDVSNLVANALMGSIGYGSTFQGTCPGVATFAVTDGTPNGPLAVVTGSGPGAFVIPVGPCAGTNLPVTGARLRVQSTFDGAGEWTIVQNLSNPVCGKPVVFLDLTTCEVSVTHVP